MIDQHFQEICAELENCDFQEVLDMTVDCFHKHHEEKETQAAFEVEFRYNWRKEWEHYTLGANEIVPLVKSLSEESVFCLSAIIIDPFVAYADAVGVKQEFRVSLANGRTFQMSYNGDIECHWRELRCHYADGTDEIIPRGTLGAGRTLRQTPAGALKIYTMNDYDLTLMCGDAVVELTEGKECLSECFPGIQAGLYFNKEKYPAPKKRYSRTFISDPVPIGCRVTVGITREGEETPECVGSKKVLRLQELLRIEDYNGGIYWNWPAVWGFEKGKMVVGVGDSYYLTFLGLLSPGQEYVFPVDDYDRHDDEHGTTHYGQVTVRWEIEKVGLEVVDGVLLSVPDQKEFVVPDEVHEIQFQALFSAPSLRKITLHPGVTQFDAALTRFHKDYWVKLDVCYEGTLQQWFDTADGLAGHIGRLVIQGKEYDFYNAEDLVIPEGVCRIGQGFFSDSETLRSVVLPPEVVEVGNRAFAYCDHLESVQVLGPAAIGASAFVSCDELSDIYLADGVVSLGTGCFNFLTNVDVIFIPLSVEKVGRLSEQNDGGCHAPTFHCAAPSKPSGWDEKWNLAYYDPRFGIGHGYDYYHGVKWGCKRETTW